MTVKDIKLRPLKVRVNVNSCFDVEGLLVANANRLFLIHNNEDGPHGDWAGDVVKQLGYSKSWCMLNARDENQEVYLEKLSWTLLYSEVFDGVDLSFRKSKRFEL